MKQVKLSFADGLVLNGQTVLSSLEGGSYAYLSVDGSELVHVILLEDASYGAKPEFVADGLYLVSALTPPRVLKPLERPFRDPPAPPPAPEEDLFEDKPPETDPAN
jgi:hypothetical protein